MLCVVDTILTTPFLTIHTNHNHELNQGVAPPGPYSRYLPLERESKWERDTKHKQNK